MTSLFTALKARIRTAWQTLKVVDAALDYRYEDYAEVRFARLEQRVALLEEQATPSDRKPA